MELLSFEIPDNIRLEQLDRENLIDSIILARDSVFSKTYGVHQPNKILIDFGTDCYLKSCFVAYTNTPIKDFLRDGLGFEIEVVKITNYFNKRGFFLFCKEVDYKLFPESAVFLAWDLSLLKTMGIKGK